MALKLRRANLQSIYAPHNFGAFEVRPAQFWGNTTCVLLSHGNKVIGAEISKQTSSKTKPFLIFLGNFCKLMTFQISIHPMGLVFKEQIFCVTLPLRFFFFISPEIAMCILSNAALLFA